MSKHLGICGFFRKDQLAGGVYSYFSNLLLGIAEVRRNDPEFTDLDVTIFHGKQQLPCQNDDFTWQTVSALGGRFGAETMVGLRQSRGLDTILFPNYFCPPIVRAERSVTVIHDLQYRWFPELYRIKKRLWMDATHAHTLRRSSRVIAISETVKQDLLDKFGKRWAAKTTSIWNPVSLDRLTSQESVELPIAGQYLMSVAMDRPQKNLATLIRAFALIEKKIPNHKLVLVGQLRSMRRSNGEHSRNVGQQLMSATELVEQLGLKDRIHTTGFVSDAMLGALYRGADLFVMPTLFEGFGMPAIEAMTMQTPTVLSDLPVLREVTLNSSNYVADPLSEQSMAKAIMATLELGPAAKPSNVVADNLRNRCAPATVARKYLDACFN